MNGANGRDISGRFARGNQFAVGTTHQRKGGRPRNEFREWCRDVMSEKGRKRLYRFAVGEDPDTGEKVRVDDRIAIQALTLLVKYGEPKPEEGKTPGLNLPAWGPSEKTQA